MSTLNPTAAGGLPAPGSRADRAFLGHPAGLGWLSFCELWERFSYYGMQALLPLYLARYLFQPEHVGQVAGIDELRAAIEWVTGPRSPLQLAGIIGGLYGGLVYLTPLAGGLVADRLLGRTKTVVLGASLMALGHFLMAFESSFLLALTCLLLGVGCFKGNIAAQVGDLYAPDDKRRASAFQIFMLAIQIAVVAAPVICGGLGEKVAWHWGFGAAGVGMVIGLFVYLAGRPHLPPEPELRSVDRQAAPSAPMTRTEKGRLVLLVALIPALMLCIIGNQQFMIGYPLWADKHVDLVLFGWEMPASWLQAIDAVTSFITMLGSLAFWKWWSLRRREPEELVKIGVGALIAAGAPALFIVASGIADATHAKLSLVWTVAYTFINDIGFANIFPVGLALYSRAAPARLQGLMLGVYYLHLFLGNNFVGWLAGLQEQMASAPFWALHAALVAAGGALLLLAQGLFGRLLAPTEADAVPAH